MLKKLIAEIVGTFTLVFAGTGAIIVNQQTNGVITHVGIAATFGLAIMIMIFAVGRVSGAHFNPAVTIGAAVAKRFEWKEVAPYIIAQCIGAFIASGALKALFPENAMLGTCAPSGSEMQSLILEAIMTFFLVFVILNSTDKFSPNWVVPAIAIGGTITLDALFGGPISGASMNPARSLAPAVVSGHMASIWVYMAGPILGGIVAAIVYALVREKE